MTLTDIITLGKMGYNKKDVDALQAAEPDAGTVDVLNQQIADLQNQVKQMQAANQNAAVHAPVQGQTPPQPEPANGTIDDILKQLAGGVPDGKQ